MASACPKCGARFPTNQKLQRHLARKRPCDPILDSEDLPEPQRNSPNRCRFCGRPYSRPDSLKRHLRGCGIANSADGTERRHEYALKKQKARFEAELARRDAEVARMAARLETLMAAAPAVVRTEVQAAGMWAAGWATAEGAGEGQARVRAEDPLGQNPPAEARAKGRPGDADSGGETFNITAFVVPK